MSVVIPATVFVLGCGLVVFGSAVRMGIVEYLPAFDPNPEIAGHIARGGPPVVLAGFVSIGTGVVQWYEPLPTVGWLLYTLAVIGLLFVGAARTGGS
jgi:hypothetical protein